MIFNDGGQSDDFADAMDMISEMYDEACYDYDDDTDYDPDYDADWDADYDSDKDKDDEEDW